MFYVFIFPKFNKKLMKFTEPVGSVSPRLTSGDKTRNIDIHYNKSATLLCPAQAYPVPFFR